MLHLRRLVLLVGLQTRWVRSQVRLLELLCCHEVAVRRRLRVRLCLRLAQRVHRRWLRVLQLVLRWSVVVDQLRRRVRQLLRRLVLVVQVHRRHRWLQARLLVLQWWHTGDLVRRQLRQQEVRPRVREHLWTRQLRLRVRQRRWR